MEEFYIEESISLANRQSKLLYVHYHHMESYNRDMAMNICANQKQCATILYNYSSPFFTSGKSIYCLTKSVLQVEGKVGSYSP